MLSESATFAYKVDNTYAPDHDAGIRWNDKELNIQWDMEDSKVLVSAKDAELPFFLEFRISFYKLKYESINYRIKRTTRIRN